MKERILKAGDHHEICRVDQLYIIKGLNPEILFLQPIESQNREAVLPMEASWQHKSLANNQLDPNEKFQIQE